MTLNVFTAIMGFGKEGCRRPGGKFAEYWPLVLAQARAATLRVKSSIQLYFNRCTSNA